MKWPSLLESLPKISSFVDFHTREEKHIAFMSWPYFCVREGPIKEENGSTENDIS